MRQRLRQHVARIPVVDGIEGKTSPEDCSDDPEAVPELQVTGHESGLPFPHFQRVHRAILRQVRISVLAFLITLDCTSQHF
jgi:hypothetical protein